MDEILNRTKQIIGENFYMTIATASAAAEPWISPVYFNFDKEYSLYWISEGSSRHSQYIKENAGKAAIVIFDSRAPNFTGDGVYFETTVKELNKEEEIKEAINVYYKGRHSKTTLDKLEATDYSEPSPWRLYKAIPHKIYKLSDTGEIVNGYYVDRKVEIDKNVLINSL